MNCSILLLSDRQLEEVRHALLTWRRCQILELVKASLLVVIEHSVLSIY